MGKFHNEKIKVMSKYLSAIADMQNSTYIQNEIPVKKIEGAIQTFAKGVDKNSILGLYDTTLFGSGTQGYLFTDDKLYYHETFEKPKKLWYDDIKELILENINKDDHKRSLKVALVDGSIIVFTSTFLNKTPLKLFLDEMKNFDSRESLKYQSVSYEMSHNFSADAGGIGLGEFDTVNKLYDEEKFHARQGHGFAAERANHLYDKLMGHDSQIIGDDNKLNGADRISDGVYIQSKYCATGSRCVNECFESDGKGSFRYMHDGKPMQIEVPSDKYDDAVKAMEEKIRRGQVEGVTNPADAKKIIRKGHFTYAQARNIAKAGTVESITYDAVNGVITASSVFGVTSMITFAKSIWSGEDFEYAVKIAAYSGLRVSGVAFISSVLASQLSKAGLNSALVGGSEAIVAVMGPKASAILINAFRSGNPIYGAAAMKSAAKLLRGNVITATITVTVLSLIDISNIFRNRISGKQLFKNLTNTVATVGGGTSGWIAGAAVGSTIIPGIGTIVGGIVGSVLGGTVAGNVTNTVVGNFVEDDADEMVKIIEKVFAELADEYLLSQKEAEKIVDRLQNCLDGNILKDMYANNDRELFARNFLLPIVEKEIRCRPIIHALTQEQTINGVRELLEDLADSMETNDQLDDESSR